MDIRLFIKRKSIHDSRSIENISDKRLRIEVQPAQTNGVERIKAFSERPFALHRQQIEKDKQNCDVAPTGKISADGHAWRLILDALSARPVTSLGHQRGEEFSESGPNFLNYMSNTFKLLPAYFSRRGEKFSRGWLCPPGYGYALSYLFVCAYSLAKRLKDCEENRTFLRSWPLCFSTYAYH